MNHLDELEAESITILREAFARIDRLGLLWSIGKDSTLILWLLRKAFFGHIPFPLVQLETHMELPEVYEFRDRLVREWNLPLIIEDCPPEAAMDPTLAAGARAAARKTEGLKSVIHREGFEGGWDVTDQPAEFWGQYKTRFEPGTHVRIHPILKWTEIDVWRYTQREGIPIVPLYLAKDGLRYRSLGEKNITLPVESDADTLDAIIAELETTKVSERSGRIIDNETEDGFERLRSAGYM